MWLIVLHALCTENREDIRAPSYAVAALPSALEGWMQPGFSGTHGIFSRRKHTQVHLQTVNTPFCQKLVKSDQKWSPCLEHHWGTLADSLVAPQ